MSADVSAYTNINVYKRKNDYKYHIQTGQPQPQVTLRYVADLNADYWAGWQRTEAGREKQPALRPDSDSQHWTIGLNFGYNPWWHHADGGHTFPFGKGEARATDDRVQWRHFIIAPEARYWFCSVFAGHFIGFNAMATCFNQGNVKYPFGLYPSLKDSRRQGKAFGIGAFYGYSWILSPHWSIEAEAGVDVGFAHFKEYNCSHCGAFLRKDTKPFVAPKVGINAVYNLK